MRTSQRSAALIAGISLLLMAVISPIGVLFALPHGHFEIAALTVLIVSALDVVVAVSLFGLFRDLSPLLSAISAALRIAYAAVFTVAASFLMAPVDEDRFRAIWELGLFLFGVHLLTLGIAAWRSAPAWIAALVVIAGVGYAIDAVSQVLSPENPLALSEFVFVGEVVLLGWCIGWAGRDNRIQPSLATD